MKVIVTRPRWLPKGRLEWLWYTNLTLLLIVELVAVVSLNALAGCVAALGVMGLVTGERVGFAHRAADDTDLDAAKARVSATAMLGFYALIVIGAFGVMLASPHR